MNKENVVLTTAYLPPVEYFAFMLKSEVFFMEGAERYQKQSLRNRTQIMTGNGVQSLIIPIVQQTRRGSIRDVKIDYTCRWQVQHWRTIVSAYNNSPYFIYFQDFFAPFYEKQYPFLFDYNLALIEVVKRLFKMETPIVVTDSYETVATIGRDLRHLTDKSAQAQFETQPYPQVFCDKFPFTPNLSIIDLLFNIGNDCRHLHAMHLLSND